MDVCQVGRRHPKREAVEQHIRVVYRQAFGAEVRDFAPRLFAGYGGDGAILCAAGMRTGESDFHSETYFGPPAEQLIASAMGRAVSRQEILEITTLACAQPGAGLRLVSSMLDYGRGQGQRIALFTGTASLRRYLKRVGVAFTQLAIADRACVVNAEVWGGYYEADPVVCAATDPVGGPRRLGMVPLCRAYDAHPYHLTCA